MENPLLWPRVVRSIQRVLAKPHSHKTMDIDRAAQIFEELINDGFMTREGKSQQKYAEDLIVDAMQEHKNLPAGFCGSSVYMMILIALNKGRFINRKGNSVERKTDKTK